MKKISLFLLSISCIFTLSACIPINLDSDSSSSSSEAESSQVQSSEKESSKKESSKDTSSEASSSQKKKKSSDSSSSSTNANTAPDFTVVDNNGNTIHLSDYKGKKIYINFWATWCGPCRNEMPELEKAYQKYKDDEDLVFISITSPNDKEYENNNDMDGSKKEILDMAKELNVTYPVLFDYQETAFSAYQIRAIPTHVFINSDGTISEQIAGAATLEYIESEIEKLY